MSLDYGFGTMTGTTYCHITCLSQFESAVSFLVANLKPRPFRLLWYFPALCFRYYRLAINFHLAWRAPCSSLLYSSERYVNSSFPMSWIIFNTDFFPFPNSVEVEPQPVRACIAGSTKQNNGLRVLEILWMRMKCLCMISCLCGSSCLNPKFWNMFHLGKII